MSKGFLRKDQVYEDEFMQKISLQLNSRHLEKKFKIKNFGLYEIIKTLGVGSLGKVKLARHTLTQETVAIKFIHKQQINSEEIGNKVMREIEILKLLHHTNLIQLYEIFETPSQVLLVTEHCTNGDLHEFISSKGKIYEFDAAKIFWQILNGLEYLHSIGIAHRDIKAENIGVSTKGIHKIMDFSLSNFQRKGGENLKTVCGSPEYVAPEIIQGKKYNGFQSDIWSCGVLLYAMVYGYLPFESDNHATLCEMIVTKKLTFAEGISQECQDLIKVLLSAEPSGRPTIPNIRKHPFFKKQKIANTVPVGLIIGQHIVPVDNNIIKQMNKLDTKTQLENNKHNADTATFYLQLRKHVNTGGKSPSEKSQAIFKPKQRNNVDIQSPVEKANAQTPAESRRTSRRFNANSLGRVQYYQQQRAQRSQQIPNLSQQNQLRVSMDMGKNLRDSNSVQNPHIQGQPSQQSISTQGQPNQQQILGGFMRLQTMEATIILKKDDEHPNINDERKVTEVKQVVNYEITEMASIMSPPPPQLSSPGQNFSPIPQTTPRRNPVQILSPQSSSPSPQTSLQRRKNYAQQLIEKKASIEEISDTESVKERKEELKEQQRKEQLEQERKAKEEEEQRKQEQRRIELFFRNPRPLKIIDKVQAKRYIMSSPYKPNANEKKISKVFYYEQPSSPIHQLILSSEQDQNIRKIYQNANYVKDDKIRRKKKYFTIDAGLETAKESGRYSQTVKRSDLVGANKTMFIRQRNSSRYESVDQDKLPEVSHLQLSNRSIQLGTLQQSDEEIILEKKQKKRRGRGKKNRDKAFQTTVQLPPIAQSQSVNQQNSDSDGKNQNT